MKLSLYFRAPIDRDYSNMTEMHCSQAMTHYEGKRFGKLSDVNVGPNGEIVIVDSSNKCVVVLDNDLNLLTVIGKGSGRSRLVHPDGVAMTKRVIAVTDHDSNQVKKYSIRGEFISVIGCKGNKNGQFEKPRGLTFNKNKLLYVVDRGNCRVQVFQQDDTFSFIFGDDSGPGKLQWPIMIDIDPDNNTLVSDHKANCIYQFSWLGNFIQKFGYTNSLLYAFAVSPTGYLITGYHGNNNKIRVWSPSYDLIKEFPSYDLIKEFAKKGSEKGEFDGIMAMAVDSCGIVYVAEWVNERLQVISDK